MANKKITDLPDSTGITDNDLFAVGDKGGASLVKAKWSAIWTKISASIIEKLVVNNLVTTAAGFLLDARQGKVLDDKFTELNTKFTNTFNAGYITNPNEMTSNFGLANGWSSVKTNFPSEFSNDFGIIITVWTSGASSNGNLGHTRAQSLLWNNKVAHRKYQDGLWSDWVVS